MISSIGITQLAVYTTDIYIYTRYILPSFGGYIIPTTYQNLWKSIDFGVETFASGIERSSKIYPTSQADYLELKPYLRAGDLAAVFDVFLGVRKEAQWGTRRLNPAKF